MFLLAPPFLFLLPPPVFLYGLPLLRELLLPLSLQPPLFLRAPLRFLLPEIIILLQPLPVDPLKQVLAANPTSQAGFPQV